MAMNSGVVRFSASMFIPVEPPFQPGVLPAYGIITTVPGIEGTFSFNLFDEGKVLRLFGIWERHLEYDDRLLEPDQCPRESRPLFVPENGRLSFIDASAPMLSAARPVLVRIAVAAGFPELLTVLDKQLMINLFPRIQIEIDGRVFSHQPVFLRGGRTITPAKKIDTPRFRAISDRDTTAYEDFAANSDIRFSHGDLYSAIALLTTQLETASYEHLKPLLLNCPIPPEKLNFNPSNYLGDGLQRYVRRSSLRTVNPGAYKACAELWGARHEVVHNGKGLIRPFNPRTGLADEHSPNKRPLTRHEFLHFRAGVHAAIVWMAKP